jgi:hypothetical protein
MRNDMTLEITQSRPIQIRFEAICFNVPIRMNIESASDDARLPDSMTPWLEIAAGELTRRLLESTCRCGWPCRCR